MNSSGIRKPFQWVLLSLLVTLTACSPHPGSGSWLPVADTNSRFSRLDIHFNGRGELHEQDIVWRCFWVGVNKSDISLDCTPSDNPENEARFQLQVIAQGSAKLMGDGNELGHFSWQAIEK